MNWKFGDVVALLVGLVLFAAVQPTIPKLRRTCPRWWCTGRLFRQGTAVRCTRCNHRRPALTVDLDLPPTPNRTSEE